MGELKKMALLKAKLRFQKKVGLCPLPSVKGQIPLAQMNAVKLGSSWDLQPWPSTFCANVGANGA